MGYEVHEVPAAECRPEGMRVSLFRGLVTFFLRGGAFFDDPVGFAILLDCGQRRETRSPSDGAASSFSPMVAILDFLRPRQGFSTTAGRALDIFCQSGEVSRFDLGEETPHMWQKCHTVSRLQTPFANPTPEWHSELGAGVS